VADCPAAVGLPVAGSCSAAVQAGAGRACAWETGRQIGWEAFRRGGVSESHEDSTGSGKGEGCGEGRDVLTAATFRCYANVGPSYGRAGQVD
jgi:hypothetical protein